MEMTFCETRAVLWDMDGTLIDSEEFHWLAWQETMAEEGIAITREQFLASFGQRNDSILPRWLAESATPERMERIADAKEKRYRALLRDKGISSLPGVSAWVHRLHEHGWRQAIASAAPRANIEVILELLKAEHLFQAVVSAEDVSRGKPDPEVFLTAAARVGVPAKRCIVVEDAAAGIEGARRAGMRSIGVGRNGKHLAADVVVASLELLNANTFDVLVPFDDEQAARKTRILQES
jgi:beta-phosphoglucomutase